jgi:hypothetical protein
MEPSRGDVPPLLRGTESKISKRRRGSVDFRFVRLINDPELADELRPA